MQKILYISQLTNMSGKLHKSVASAVDTGLTKGKVNAFVFKVKKYIPFDRMSFQFTYFMSAS